MLIGGAAGPKLFAHVAEYADGWIPIGGAGIRDALPALHAACEARGRDPQTLRIVPFGTVPNPGKIEYYASLGIDEIVLRVPSAGADRVLPLLDRYAELVGAMTAPALVGLDAAGTPEAWAAAGFTVVDGVVTIGHVAVRVGVGEKGLAAWTLTGVPDTTDVDGLPTRVTDDAPPEPVEHPNGASLIDHLVVWSPDDARTIEAFTDLGLEVERVREDARPGFRQTFLRAGEVIVELVARRSASRRRARRGSSASRAPSPISTRALISSATASAR